MNILIIGPAWVGDMVMAQVLFKFIKMRHPDAIIDVIAPDFTRPLLDRMPEISNILSLPFKHGELAISKRWKLGKTLRNQYDEAIVLPNSWKSAIIPFAARIKKRTGFRGEFRYGLLNNVKLLNKKLLPLMIQRFAFLGLEKNEVLPDKLPKPKLIANPITAESSSKKIIALCPGAEFGPSKRWPEEHYATLANKLLEHDFELWLFGSLKDKVITDKINELTNNQCKNLAGTTSLSEAIDLLALASLVITNDSGLMHIAAALDKPLIALYGSTDPGFTPPLSTKAKILSIDLYCRPCFQRECPLKHHRCMKDLSPQLVWETIHSCEF
ncbi:MAG TPA: lipopolysaccharide heptosyltransferase II [Gammaproteobacteria bacterium]|nr:lipopolysaccharide heptosyltransferase II [Gammaproteobacteria bacterium]